jgi:hypothetical protein
LRAIPPARFLALLNLQGRCVDAAELVPDAAALALGSRRKPLPLRTLQGVELITVRLASKPGVICSSV